MGHARFGVLAKSRKWRQVVDKLWLGASVNEIAALVAEAAETRLRAAAGDPAFSPCLFAKVVATVVPVSSLAVRDQLVRDFDHPRSASALLPI